METPEQPMCPNCITPWKCNGPHTPYDFYEEAWKEMTASDNVNSPKHYQGKGMEVIDVIDAFDLDLYQGSIVQYIIRYKHKNGIEDVRKAHWYISRLLDRLEKKNVSASSSAVGHQSNYSTRLHDIDSGFVGVSGVYLREEGLRVGETGGSCIRYDEDERGSGVGRSYPYSGPQETTRTTGEGS